MASLCVNKAFSHKTSNVIEMSRVCKKRYRTHLMYILFCHTQCDTFELLTDWLMSAFSGLHCSESSKQEQSVRLCRCYQATHTLCAVRALALVIQATTALNRTSKSVGNEETHALHAAPLKKL